MAETRTFTIMVSKYPGITGITNEHVVQIHICDSANGKDFATTQRGPDEIGALALAMHFAADFLVRELKGEN